MALTLSLQHARNQSGVGDREGGSNSGVWAVGRMSGTWVTQKSPDEVGTLTLLGARLLQPHAVHREPTNSPTKGALLPLALLVTLLQADACDWQPVPTVALCTRLQAGIDIGPAGTQCESVQAGPRAQAGIQTTVKVIKYGLR